MKNKTKELKIPELYYCYCIPMSLWIIDSLIDGTRKAETEEWWGKFIGKDTEHYKLVKVNDEDKFKDIVFNFPEDPNDLDTIQLLKETVKRDDFKEVKGEYLADKDKELTNEDVFKLNLDPDDELQNLIVEFFDRPHIAEYLKEAAEKAKEKKQ